MLLSCHSKNAFASIAFVGDRGLYRGKIQFDIAAFFEPYVRQWLVNTDSKTEQWAQAVSVLEVVNYASLM